MSAVGPKANGRLACSQQNSDGKPRIMSAGAEWVNGSKTAIPTSDIAGSFDSKQRRALNTMPHANVFEFRARRARVRPGGPRRRLSFASPPQTGATPIS